ncbi:MAG: CubicO group peptidase (beta-lactamase class C family) [Rhodothermales bacterium]|jgi:CubicO group peptidase (beta-lactamase class C family)
MSKLKTFALILLLMVAWTAFLLYGVSDGFILRSITSGDTPRDFVAAVEDAVAEEFVGNLALLVLEDGKPAASLFHSVGTPVSDTTVFQMASISKWVTAWGVFKLVQDGRLDLDAPVDSYLTRWQLPDSEFDNDQVTVRRLLSHTSGLVDDLGYSGFLPGEPVQTIEESLDQASDSPWSEGRAVVGLEPGSQYMYSGAAYTILQLLIEEVSGQSFQVYMTETVFLPLGMRRSTFVWSDSLSWDRAASYDADGSEADYKRFTALAAASLNTTISDLALFVNANVAANNVLTPTSLDQMYTPHAFVNDFGIHALGPTIFARDGKGLMIHGHDGYGDPTLNTAARINRDTGDGIIVFETGHPNFASSMADHWIFWKTGIADFVVITGNKNWLLTLLLGGYGVILLLVLLRRRRRRTS